MESYGYFVVVCEHAVRAASVQSSTYKGLSRSLVAMSDVPVKDEHGEHGEPPRKAVCLAKFMPASQACLAEYKRSLN